MQVPSLTLPCAKCASEKPITDYGSDDGHKKYISGVCLECTPTCDEAFLLDHRMKYCTKCKQYHLLSEFYVINKKRYTASYCKACMKIITKARYDTQIKENPEKVRKYSKDYYLANKDKLRRYQENYTRTKKGLPPIEAAVESEAVPS
jgi:hypothetical protein